MKRLIVNADDFGFDEAVNYGILKGYQEGIVTSTSMMANMPGFAHAVTLAKQHRDLGIGVHLTLTCYYPLGKGYKSLTRRFFFKLIILFLSLSSRFCTGKRKCMKN